MRPVTSETFGLLIAYLIPGLIALWGSGAVHPEGRVWLGTDGSGQQNVGGFLYATVAAIGAGLTVSTLRWVVIDRLHHWTGVTQPAWNFRDLATRTEAFSVLIEIHYRYYQFYANSLIAVLLTIALVGWTEGLSIEQAVIATGLIALFYAGSRDTLSKYYKRVEAMLAATPEQTHSSAAIAASQAETKSESDRPQA